MAMLQYFTDQMNRSVAISISPQRIISLVPSQTELLFHLGVASRVVGITKFCVHPKDQVRSKEKIGGTKKLNLDKIRTLQPDLIIANKEENEKDQIELLAREFPVWVSDIHSLEDATNMIQQVGEIVGKSTTANTLALQIQTSFDSLQATSIQPAPPSVAYFIWRKPYMVAAQNTFIHQLLELGGFENIFSDETRYPEISLDDLKKRQPSAILLSTEPYPFKAQHFEEFKSVCPKAVIRIVDGELFSWYGNRLLHSAAYLGKLRTELLQKTKSA